MKYIIEADENYINQLGKLDDIHLPYADFCLSKGIPAENTETLIKDKNYFFNVNYHIKVKLNERGMRILSADLIESGISPTNVPSLLEKCYPLKDGYRTFQLWDFMRIFGIHFDLGAESPIWLNDIVISGKDLEEYDRQKET